jgi:hypothetical protein
LEKLGINWRLLSISFSKKQGSRFVDWIHLAPDRGQWAVSCIFGNFFEVPKSREFLE